MTKSADLTKYLRPGQALVSASKATEQPADSQQPYEAYQLSTDAKRHLEIRLKFPDPAECPVNAMMTNIRYEWRMGLAITIIYGNALMVAIKGERLQALAKAIQEWKVEWVEAFDADMHLPLTDENVPFIRSIEIITERPEELPPLPQRH